MSLKAATAALALALTFSSITAPAPISDQRGGGGMTPSWLCVMFNLC